jgi:glutamine synthetase
MSTNRHVHRDRLEADIRDGSIDTVVVAFADHQGRLVGKRSDGEHFLDVVAKEGTENCDYLLACDLEDVPIPGFRWASYEQGYGDMRGVVDATTIRYLPWASRTALAIVDLVERDGGAPVAVSPRRILQSQVERARQLGLVPMVGTEIEFFLFEESYDDARASGYAALTPRSPYPQDYHLLRTAVQEDVLGALRRGLRQAGFPVEFSKGEAGRGQHEVNLTFDAAVECADMGVVFKHAVKEIAQRHGRSATFMAKPHADDAGSSCHVHVSAWDLPAARNLMPGRGGEGSAGDHGAGDERGHSDVFRWFLGGLLASAAELTLLVAPNVNSFKRFQAGSWAPTAVGWDVDNRTLGFRVVGHGDALRIENRIPGADANPYHAIAATIAGGLHGIAHRIEPPPAHAGDGYVATDLERIPTTFPEAIERWRSSELARAAFGDDVHHHVLHHAEAEWRAFNATVTDWERRRYFEQI